MDTLAGNLLFVDLKSMEFNKIPLKKRQSCLCAKDPEQIILLDYSQPVCDLKEEN